MSEPPNYAPTPVSPVEQADAHSAAEQMREAARQLESEPVELYRELSESDAYALAAWLRSAAEEAEQIGADFRALRFARSYLNTPGGTS